MNPSLVASTCALGLVLIAGALHQERGLHRADVPRAPTLSSPSVARAALTPSVAPTFCETVQSAYRAAGEPQGNQSDWLWENYAGHFEEASRCLDEYNDDPPPLYLDPDVKSVTPITEPDPK